MDKITFYFNEKHKDLFAVIDNGIELLSYSHIGQHSGICQEYINESRLATEEEYKDLKEELKRFYKNI